MEMVIKVGKNFSKDTQDVIDSFKLKYGSGKTVEVEETEKEFIVFKKKADLQNLYLEVSSKCNLECITCVRREWGDFEGKDMDMKLLEQIISQLQDFPHLSRIHLGGFGEPLIHPEITRIVRLLKKQNLRVTMSTNGTLLTPELSGELIIAGIDKITFSIDGFQEDIFQQIRVKGTLEQVLQNIAGVREKKKELESYKPQLGIEFVMMHSNKDQVSLLPQMAKKFGISSILLTNLLAYTPQMYSEVLYELPHQNRQLESGILAPLPWNKEAVKDIFPPTRTWCVYEQGYIAWGTMNPPRMYWSSERKCTFVANDSTVIRHDGKIFPCYALMYSHEYYLDNRVKKVSPYILGDLSQTSLLDAWNSREYLKFRYRVRNFNFAPCMECEVREDCEYALNNEDCWGNSPSCADCLWAQGIVKCP